MTTISITQRFALSASRLPCAEQLCTLYNSLQLLMIFRHLILLLGWLRERIFDFLTTIDGRYQYQKRSSCDHQAKISRRLVTFIICPLSQRRFSQEDVDLPRIVSLT